MAVRARLRISLAGRAATPLPVGVAGAADATADAGVDAATLGGGCALGRSLIAPGWARQPWI